MGSNNTPLWVREQRTMTDATVRQMMKQVADLFQVNAGFVLQVSNYHQLCEQEKRRMCSTFLPITLCKVPARDGNGVLFFLSKEAAL